MIHIREAHLDALIALIIIVINKLMKNYDCITQQGFLQLIIIFFMQEIGGNI